MNLTRSVSEGGYLRHDKSNAPAIEETEVPRKFYCSLARMSKMAMASAADVPSSAASTNSNISSGV